MRRSTLHIYSKMNRYPSKYKSIMHLHSTLGGGAAEKKNSDVTGNCLYVLVLAAGIHH